MRLQSESGRSLRSKQALVSAALRPAIALRNWSASTESIGEIAPAAWGSSCFRGIRSGTELSFLVLGLGTPSDLLPADVRKMTNCFALFMLPPSRFPAFEKN